MVRIDREQLIDVTYLDVTAVQDRTVNLMPFWDGTSWHQWVPGPTGLIKALMKDAVEGDYVATKAAQPVDLFIPFVNLIWQRASWPEVCPLISSVIDDIHDIAAVCAKLRHFEHYEDLTGSVRRFVKTDIEHLTVLCRGIFDLLQEAISWIWNTKVKLHDSLAERQRKQRRLHRSFRKVVLNSEERIASAKQIGDKYSLPPLLCDTYHDLAGFFSYIRRARDKVVHGTASGNLIFATDRGFCVSPTAEPFDRISWRPEHYFNENIVFLTPWIAHIVMCTLESCNRLTTAFSSVISLPREIAPGYNIFLRGVHNKELLDTLADAHRKNDSHAATPFWD